MYKRFGGFTIVELMIVVVVIAILASISVVAYTGIQQRAINSKTISTASSYNRALAVYLAANGSYPPMPQYGTYDSICLGVGYRDTDGDGQPDCGDSSYPSTSHQPFNDGLAELIGEIGALDNPLPTPYQPGSTFTGIIMIRSDNFTIDGENNPYYMKYVLSGANQSCQLTTVQEVSGSQPYPTMRSSTRGYSWSDGTTTMCVVPLPNPS